MVTIAVVGAAGVVAQASLPLLEPFADRLIGLDAREPARWRRRSDVHQIDLAHGDAKPLLEGVDVLIDLGGISDPVPDTALMTRVNIEGTTRLLDAAGAVGVRKIIRLSNVSVYGAWPNSPVPLNEDEPMRPVPGFVPATHAAEVERRLIEWRDAHPGTVVTVLRTALVGGPGVDHLAARLVAGVPPLVVRGADPKVQSVHLDDVARAVALAVERNLDGVYNVAADGWTAANEVRAMSAMRFRLALPQELAARVLDRVWPTGLVDLPPSGLPYLVNPPVVANDRLRGAGWSPQVSNRDAIAAAIAAEAPLVRQSARAALGALVAGVVATTVLAVAATWSIKRWRGARRSNRSTRA